MTRRAAQRKLRRPAKLMNLCSEAAPLPYPKWDMLSHSLLVMFFIKSGGNGRQKGHKASSGQRGYARCDPSSSARHRHSSVPKLELPAQSRAPLFVRGSATYGVFE
jgi:hypothetical protein